VICLRVTSKRCFKRCSES